MPEAVSIRCHRCGGVFGFLPYPGNARCPYCAFDQPVSAEFLAELQRYAGNVGREIAQADQAYQRAAGWQQWAEQSDRAVPRLKIVIPLVSGFTLLVALAIPATQALGIPPDRIGAVAGPLLSIPGLFLMGYIIWLYSGSGPAAKRAAAGRISVACPNCGALGELVAGAASQTCSYCRTALVASQPVMAQGIDAAELAHRRARIEEFRQERLGMVGLARYDMTPYVPYIVLGSFLPMLGGGAAALSVEMLRGNEPYHPAIFAMWALTFAVVAVLCAVYLRRRSRRQRSAEALADLGRQFPLERLPDLPQVAYWLNRYWPAKYDSQWLLGGPYFVGASLGVLGYPALLNANFDGDAKRKPRLHVLLAAHHRAGFRAHGEAGDYVQRALAYCRKLGFEVTPSEAGLLAIADDETVRIVTKNPEALHQVAAVLGALANAARASGSIPAAAAA